MFKNCIYKNESVYESNACIWKKKPSYKWAAFCNVCMFCRSRYTLNFLVLCIKRFSHSLLKKMELMSRSIQNMHHCNMYWKALNCSGRLLFVANICLNNNHLLFTVYIHRLIYIKRCSGDRGTCVPSGAQYCITGVFWLVTWF